jgi:rubrerythrin
MAPKNDTAPAPVLAEENNKGKKESPKDRTPMQWFAWFLNRTAVFVRWAFGTVLPLYLVIGTICFIAIPKGIFPSVLPFFQEPNAVVVANTSPAPASPVISVRPSSEQRPELKIAEVAKMTIDATKERIDMMKESYDKLFSLIAALGALLAFFGFKGVETFISTRAKAEETVEKAETAIAKAKAAQETAEAAVASLNNFLHTKYEKDNAAELNVSQSIILRELADMYKELTSKETAMNPKDSTYCEYLRSALYYIDKVTDNPEGVDVRILSRAFVVRGNILSRLGDRTGALKMVEIAFGKYFTGDHSAYFNAACYACLLAGECAKNDDHRGAVGYENKSLSYLKQAIDLWPDYRAAALKDNDFEYFREKKYSPFLALMEAKI